MLKLLDEFSTNPNEKTAKRLLVYLERHPMSACFLSERDGETIARARTIFKAS